MIRLVKLPRPLLSTVRLSFIVGFCEVLQQTPRAVTGEIPSKLMLPPQEAEVHVTLFTVAVVNAGVATGVIKFRCIPYTVPVLLVAYART